MSGTSPNTYGISSAVVGTTANPGTNIITLELQNGTPLTDANFQSLSNIFISGSYFTS